MGLWSSSDNPGGGALPSTEELQNIVDADGTSGVNCFVKTIPKVQEDMEVHVAKMGVYAIIGAIFFGVTALATCCFMFTLGTKKQGKKGAGAMVFKLLCPCCSQEAGARKGEPRYTDMDYDSES